MSRSSRPFSVALLALVAAVVVAVPSSLADTTAQALPFSQNWTNIGQITANDNWSGVPGIIGYRGDGLTGAPGTDPQGIVADGSGTPVNVIANQTNPNTLSTGGIAEFHITDPVVALQGSGTADAPHLVITLNTTGAANVGVTYNVRDVDGAADNAIQQVALQYRVGTSGNYTNIPAGFVADATTGPSLATLVTPVSVTLPVAASNQPVVQLRVITNDAVGSDEWVGIDDISVTAGAATDLAPTVQSTTPTNGGTNVATNANISITFSEAVNVTGTWFTISCGTSGSHTATVTGGPTTFTLDPSPDFANSETCTVTVVATQVTDQDSDDPPDNMTGDYVFMFTTAAPPPPLTLIHDVQGATHISPMNSTSVSVRGIVTGKRSNGFYMQEEDADADANDATSEGIFVFTSSAPANNVGDNVTVTGVVSEFRPGGSSSTNLTTTELGSPVIATNSTGNFPLPTAIVIGSGGRTPPNMVIENDATGDVETSGVFDPATDGIDFYESLEGMRATVNNPVVTGPTKFGEIPVLADDGLGASVRTTRGGIVVRPNDFNPERIFLDDEILLVTAGSMPLVNVSDHLAGSVTGVFDYSFGNFKLELTTSPTLVSAGLTQEVASAPVATDLSIATFNVNNLDPGDGATKFNSLAGTIVNNLRSPDIVALEEIQDNNGPTDNGVVDASTTFTTLISAITGAGGPTYDYRQIDPVDDQDGGEPGGNIRVGYLFNPSRVTFVDKPGATSTTPNTVSATGLQYSPGRIDPTNAAFNSSRKPLAAEFTFNSQKVFLIANHFNSKGGDEPLFGHPQPPTLSSEVQRNQQAAIVNSFVDDIIANVTNPQIVVLGDFNDFEFSNPLSTLKGGVLTDEIETLPQAERYTYVFDGNSQALDHILVNNGVTLRLPTYDVVHVNSEFAVQNSDHEPQLLRYDPTSTPSAVVVTSLVAARRAGSVVLRWRTGSEVGVAGFNVYRERAGRKVRLNRTLIAAAGTPLGRRYSWTAGRTGSARFWLQVVGRDGSRAWHGPVRASGRRA